MITSEQIRIIDRWISAVETGTPDGDYGKVTVMHDGPGGVRQITFGKHQTTEKGGNLKELVREIAQNLSILDTVLRKELLRFLDSPLYSCVDDLRILSALSMSGEAKPEIQDAFFEKKYWIPACRWAEKNGFQSALAHLVIYDSFIQSGGILMFLRKRFPEPVPVNGGREERWLYQYVTTRHQWLKYWGNGKDPKSVTIRKTVYRTKGLLELIERGAWQLDGQIAVNGIKVA